MSPREHIFATYSRRIRGAKDLRQNRAIARQPERISVWASGVNTSLLTLSLFMVGVLGADNHNLAVAFDDLAFVAHRLNRRSDFHDGLL